MSVRGFVAQHEACHAHTHGRHPQPDASAIAPGTCVSASISAHDLRGVPFSVDRGDRRHRPPDKLEMRRQSFCPTSCPLLQT